LQRAWPGWRWRSQALLLLPMLVLVLLLVLVRARLPALVLAQDALVAAPALHRPCGARRRACVHSRLRTRS